MVRTGLLFWSMQTTQFYGIFTLRLPVGTGHVMSNADVHRRRALRFLELAEKIADPDRRAKALDLAIKWMVRAREASQSTSPVAQQIQPESVDR
jgi:hypothetical protein